MRNLRQRILSAVLSAAMLLSLTSGATAAETGSGQESGGSAAVEQLDTVSGVTRGAVAQQIYEYFNWSHRDEYNDVWAPEMDHFTDVTKDNENWMAIECLLQQGVVEDTDTYRPDADLTYGEAVAMLNNAFGQNAASKLTDYNADSMKDQIIPKETWDALFTAMTEDFVSPVQALPIANTDDVAPRRYIKLWTPTDGATIYFKKTVSHEGYDENITLNIEEAKPADYTAKDDTDKSLDATLYTQIYTVDEDGYIKEDYSQYEHTYVTYKVMAVKDGKESAVRTYKWHLYRPTDADQENGGYQYTLVREKTDTSPAVYQICRDAESLRPMAWYIEGQTSGVLMDALQTSANNDWNMKDCVDKIATKPYVLVVGHAHPDHDAQMGNFVTDGITTYANSRGWSSLKRLGKMDTAESQALVKDINEGDSFDLGGCTLNVHVLPGHHDSLVILADHSNGLVFATDIYGCTRAGSADNVDVSGIPADLLLSLTQQLRNDYEREGTEVQEVYTGHDELPLDRNVLLNFETDLQKVIDGGDDATSYTLRGGNNAMYSRTSIVGDMWKNGTNWLSLKLGGIKGDETTYLSQGSSYFMNTTEEDTAINENLNYNGGNYKQYSVLSNVEVTGGGQLEGVDLSWKAPSTLSDWGGVAETPINYTLHDKFNPWHYAYDISIPAENSKISIDATTMSTKAKITSITLDGQTETDLDDLTVKDGSVIKVVVTAQDNQTTSTYTFTATLSRDLDDIKELSIDWTQASQLPLTGYFTKTISEGRTVKVYIAENASIRSYFTVVAVPDDVDTYQYLSDNGWIALAEEKGEGLFVLEPGASGWGTAANEKTYVDAAMNFLKSGTNDNKVGVFSTFGEFYLVGYGKGAAALELWAANNPLFVISQAYVSGESLTSAQLTAAGATAYDGENTGGYAAIEDSAFTTGLTNLGLSGQITNKDIPVPTWFVGSYAKDSASVTYWKTANDAGEFGDDGVAYQAKNSDALQTAYANSQLPASATHGISQVKLTTDTTVKAADIYSFLSTYTRYDNTFAYSNALAYRLDYTAARVGAQKQAAKGETLRTYTTTDYAGETQTVAVLGQDSVDIAGHGTVQVGVFSFSDNNGDGKNDPREYLVYIPENHDGKALPVLYVYPGNTQTDGIFFDCTQWYQLADSEGIALVFVNETYSSAVAITHKDAIYYQTAMLEVLKKDIDDMTVNGTAVKLDFTRVYGTGQSLGSMTTQGFASSNPEFFAAVASTSGVDMGISAVDFDTTGSGDMIPTYMISGQSDLEFLLPDLSAKALTSWANYFLGVNGLGTLDTNAENYGASKYELLQNRYDTYTWTNSDNIPLFQWGQTQMRTHNCYPGEMSLLWNFMKHYSVSEDGTRYYSANATFADGDKQEITRKTPSTDDIKSIQAYTDDTFYGTGLVKVVITYNDDVKMSDYKFSPWTYDLEDRGSLTPDYGQIKIASVTVSGQTVTLEIEDLTDATENNKLIYNGANAEGSRERNAFGIYCTGNWYRDPDGQIYYGNTDDTTKGYKANNKYTDADGTAYVMGYQPRASLELKLRHVDEKADKALALADDKGQYTAANKWLETVDQQFGKGKFQSFEDLGIQIQSTGSKALSPNIKDGTDDDYVRGYAYIPANYNPSNGIVFTFQGQGICYWKLPDGSNNAGTAMMYDSATTSWSYTHPGAIVVQLNDRSSFGPGDYYANGYDFVKDDAEVMKYFVDTYGVTGPIVVQGNSRGTMAASMVIKALAGQEYNPMNQRANVAGAETSKLDTTRYGFTVDAFICQNGTFGYQYDEADWTAVAKTNLRVWVFDGEQDTNNYDTVTAYTARMTALNGADWAAENIRITGYNSEIYYYWGESDHSTTRVNGWYFSDTAYYGPSAYIDESTGELKYTEKLANGATYKLQGRGQNAVKANYVYKIYDESYQDWALGTVQTTSTSSGRNPNHTASTPTTVVTPPSNSTANTQVTQTPAVTVNSNGEAVVDMTAAQITSAISSANTSAADELVIKPTITGDASKVTVSLPQQSVADLANNGKLAVTVASDLANVTIPNAGLAQLAKENGAVTVSAEAAADNSGAVKIDVSVGGKSVDSLSSGITATLPAANATPGSVMVLVNADGTETIVKKSVVGSDGVSGLLNGSATVKVVDNTKTFSDMNGHWSASFVNFASSRQLFNGTSDTTFSPDLSMSRAMLSTVLWSLEGSTTGNAQSSLSDVASGAWYGEAVNWATSNGLITGYADGTFGGDDSVTREQLAVILYNYANLQGVNTSASGNLAQFNDNGNVSSWASNAMGWAVGAGLISGTGNNTLDPAGTATRAQVAVMMQNMIGLLVGTGK